MDHTTMSGDSEQLTDQMNPKLPVDHICGAAGSRLSTPSRSEIRVLACMVVMGCGELEDFAIVGTCPALDRTRE